MARVMQKLRGIAARQKEALLPPDAAFPILQAAREELPQKKGEQITGAALSIAANRRVPRLKVSYFQKCMRDLTDKQREELDLPPKQVQTRTSGG